MTISRAALIVAVVALAGSGLFLIWHTNHLTSIRNQSVNNATSTIQCGSVTSAEGSWPYQYSDCPVCPTRPIVRVNGTPVEKWVRYSNTELRFAFDYPEGWNVTDSVSSSTPTRYDIFPNNTSLILTGPSSYDHTEMLNRAQFEKIGEATYAELFTEKELSDVATGYTQHTPMKVVWDGAGSIEGYVANKNNFVMLRGACDSMLNGQSRLAGFLNCEQKAQIYYHILDSLEFGS